MWQYSHTRWNSTTHYNKPLVTHTRTRPPTTNTPQAYTPRTGVAQTQLTVTVVAKGVHISILQQDHGVVHATGNLRHVYVSRPNHHLSRRQWHHFGIVCLWLMDSLCKAKHQQTLQVSIGCSMGTSRWKLYTDTLSWFKITADCSIKGKKMCSKYDKAGCNNKQGS